MDNDYIRIMRMTDDHIPSFRECLCSVARERAYLAFTEAPPLEDVETFVRGAREGGAVQYVAVDDRGSVAGWCDIIPVDMEGFRHVGRLGIGVRARDRGHGIGKRLMEAAIAEAPRRGIERIELEVFASNARAAALYRRFGFEMEGVRRRARKLDGVYENLIMMALFPGSVETENGGDGT